MSELSHADVCRPGWHSKVTWEVWDVGHKLSLFVNLKHSAANVLHETKSYSLLWMTFSPQWKCPLFFKVILAKYSSSYIYLFNKSIIDTVF